MENEINSHPRSSRLSARIMKVMGVFSGVQALGILCSVVRTKLIALWIGATGVGLFGIFNSAIDLISTLTMLGITQSSVRDIAANDHNPTLKARIVTAVRCWGVLLGLLGAITVALLSPLLSNWSFGDTNHAWSFAALAVVMFFNALTQTRSAILQGLKRYRALACASVWGAAGGVIISAPMFRIWGEKSIIPALICFSLVSYATMKWFSPGLKTEQTPISRRETMKIGRGFITLGIYLTISSVFTFGSSYLFLSWLNKTASVTEVGFFQAGYTLFNRYAGIIFTAIGVEFFPRLATVSMSRTRASVYVNHEASLILRLILPMTALMIVLAPVIVRILYSSEFIPVVPLVVTGICGTALRGVSWCMAFTMIARNDGRVYLVSELASALLYLMLSIGGYKLIGLEGIGIAYIIWYALYLTMVYVICRRRYGFGLYRRIKMMTAVTMTIGITMAALALTWPGLWWINVCVCAVVCWFSGRSLLRLWRR